ncbi:MAG: helix-turn-helix domain-containing protein [Acidimicrobiia bacterium]|jgi:AcrR family transcriptional regulator
MATTATSTVTPRRRLGPAERRAQILDSAAGVFADRGYGSTSIASVATAAGVTPRILYRHFASKDALYRAVLERSLARLARVFAVPAGRYGVDPALLLEAGRADAEGFRALWRHAVHEEPYRDVAEQCRADAVDCARRGLASWTPPDALDWAARAVVGYELEAVLNWLDYGRPADDARFARATRAALAAGVRAWSSPGPE